MTRPTMILTAASVLVALPVAAQQERNVGAAQADCTPTTTAPQFDGGYEVSMCYVTPDGGVGLPPAIILEKIETSECDFDVSAEALSALVSAGVGEDVVMAMMVVR